MATLCLHSIVYLLASSVVHCALISSSLVAREDAVDDSFPRQRNGNSRDQYGDQPYNHQSPLISSGRKHDKENQRLRIYDQFQQFYNSRKQEMIVNRNSSSSSPPNTGVEEDEEQLSKTTTVAVEPTKSHRNRTRGRKTRFVIIGERVLNSSNDDGVVQFVLDNAKLNAARLHVTGANVLVLIRLNQTTSTTFRVGRRRRSHRLLIKVYVIDDSGGGAGERDQNIPIAYLNIIPRHSRWEHVLLPTSVVQAAFDSGNRVLRLWIVCDNCREGEQVATTDDEQTTAAKKKPTIARSIYQTRKQIGARVEEMAAEAVGGGCGEQPCLIIHARTGRASEKGRWSLVKPSL